MSGEVVTFTPRESKEEHLAGSARCIACGHRWEAVAPVGTVELECPSCSTLKGLFVHSCSPEQGYFWRCACGCDVFYITPASVRCWQCALPQSGY